MVDLDRAQEIAAEPDRMDHEAPDALHRGPHPRVRPRVFDHHRLVRCDRLGAERRGPFGRLAPAGPAERAPVRQRRDSVDHSVDPEVAPVEQPVGQPLDLIEGTLERPVAGDRHFHQVDLVQILRADRLLQNPAREHAEDTHRHRHGHPAHGESMRSAATATTAAISVSR